jgi:hypothetical protein
MLNNDLGCIYLCEFWNVIAWMTVTIYFSVFLASSFFSSFPSSSSSSSSYSSSSESSESSESSSLSLSVTSASVVK